MMLKIKQKIISWWMMDGDDEFLSDVIQKLVIRFSQIQPEEELLVLSLPKFDMKERNRCIDEMVSFLKSYIYGDSQSSKQ